MFRNFFKIAYRNLLKNKIFSLVNIFGLAIGMAACFFIFQYVHFEKSYDRFNKNAANLYRVNISFTGSFSNTPVMATNHPAVGPALKLEYPEVLGYARLVDPVLFVSSLTMSYTDKGGAKTSYNEPKTYLADSSFLTLFSYPFVEGDPATALTQPSTVVISSSEAEKYFGKEEPMGKTLYLNQKIPLKVTGVFKDVPENSHIKFDVLISFRTLEHDGRLKDPVWTWPEFYNYVLLAPGTDPRKIEARFPALIEEHLGPIMKTYKFGCAFHLQPITDIHLKSHYLKEAEVNGSEREIQFLTLIGIFILVIAWINYINLSTAKSTERAKEVGLRKVSGSTRIQLIGQFILESALINGLALFVAAIIVFCCFSAFSVFIGKDIRNGSGAASLWHTTSFWLVLVGTFLTSAFLVGAYPAFVLSNFKPALVLKGKFTQSNKGILLRKVLVSFQFVLSILLIGGTITVSRQLFFMRNQDLGYNKDQVFVIKAPPITDTSYFNKINLFKTELARNPSVNNVAVSSDIPGREIFERNSIRKYGEDASQNSITYFIEVDDHFIPTFQTELAAGSNFRRDEAIDFRTRPQPGSIVKVIINEALARALGFKTNEAALHQQLDFESLYGFKSEVIGVIRNYHQRSLKEEYDPILYYYPEVTGSWGYFSVNLSTQNLRHDLASIESIYKDIFPEHPYQYFFLNEFFDQQYKADQQFGKVFLAFTILAIFVACLGLLGLSSFAISLRTKEIGIRKVLGSSVSGIIVLFSKDFVKLVCLSAVIAIPVIYYLSVKWLSNYAFRTRLSWLNFVVPPLLLLVVALLTVFLQSIKAARANPVKSLRTD
ncbi:MAG: ABC transporter permease [Puia sp.]|nr:ABC transporter permease [Puia sp.]